MKQITNFWNKITKEKWEDYVRKDFWGNRYFGRRRVSILSKLITGFFLLLVLFFFLSPLFIQGSELRTLQIIFLTIWIIVVLNWLFRKK